MPSQSMIIGVLVALILSFSFGYVTGGHSVRVEYQEAIDEQKAEADKLIQENIKQIAEVTQKNEATKQAIEKERQKNVKTTNDLRTKLANSSLRFNSSRESCSDTMPFENTSTDNTSATFTELPAKITTSLRELAFDCDTLRDDYNTLYQFVQE